jgi:hypothetical protein
MEVLREIYIQTSGLEQIEVFVGELEKSLPPGWVRDRNLEAEVGHSVSSGRLFFFNYDGDDRFPRTTIFLVEDEPTRLRLSSIFFRSSRELDIRRFNDLLEEFYRSIIEPCAERMGVRVELTSGDEDLSHWLSDAALDKFRRFSSSADKRAGYLLSRDRERWLEFVLAAHRERSRLDAGTLRRWLIEVERWSPEVADILAGQYAFAEELLTFSESHRAGA